MITRLIETLFKFLMFHKLIILILILILHSVSRFLELPFKIHFICHSN